MISVTADKLPQHHSREFRGIPLVIEWPKGSERVGVDKETGEPWKNKMYADYGYIPSTEGEDGDKIDVYVGPNEDAENAYAVEQLMNNGELDEYKIFLGFDSLEDVEETFLLHKDEKHLGEIAEIPFDYLFDTVEKVQGKTAEFLRVDDMRAIGRGDMTAQEYMQGKRWEPKEAPHDEDSGSHTVIDAFLKNYQHEVDFYDECATLVHEKLEQALQEAGIKAVVSSRAKRPERLRKKLVQREQRKGREYRTFRDIYEDIIDLAGCRVALYMPADRPAVGVIIEKLFVPIRDTKHFPKDRGPGDSLGYIADHYLVQLRPETLRKKELRYADTQVEIQVASVLMHAWAEVTHDLLYKPEKGNLTAEEMLILKDLNDIVQSGEAQLEKLQTAIEGRTDEDLRFEITSRLKQMAKVAAMGPRLARLTLQDLDANDSQLAYGLYKLHDEIKDDPLRDMNRMTEIGADTTYQKVRERLLPAVREALPQISGKPSGYAKMYAQQADEYLMKAARAKLESHGTPSSYIMYVEGALVKLHQAIEEIRQATRSGEPVLVKRRKSGWDNYMQAKIRLAKCIQGSNNH
jgi:ppGpp synthetase/RelA/SpoT-type nucleotidyltranferase